jgi:hypothetical protein
MKMERTNKRKEKKIIKKGCKEVQEYKRDKTNACQIISVVFICRRGRRKLGRK